ncbi:CD99 antigen isoform X2 [Acipenser oxyrinchus oxyrinchus]|uniref:CD99 antigen isoform X2 n=1 Tax=Acipenser oxyrinchus oxyrinchus TaxID=40147 RepID=A0AAD8G8S0_ACIOX|nr:CD99 antigen isoform X2 [Acipenser oxyrinchus oxyrinchus]
MLSLRVVVFASLAFALAAQDFDLSDALDDAVPTKPPSKPAVEKPKEPSNELDLGDALGGGEINPQPTKPAAKPAPRDKGNSDFDLSDALGGGDSQPKQPDRKPVPGGTNTGSGGNFDLDDLKDAVDGGYNPDENKGRSAGGSSDTNVGGDVQEAGSGQLAGIISAVGMAVVGAASSYFAYQKKKLCFKVQGGGAENVNQNNQHGNQSDPQLFSNLLKQSP